MLRILLTKGTGEVAETLSELKSLIQSDPEETQETLLTDDGLPVLTLCLLIAPLVAPTVTLLLALSFSASADLFVQQLTDPTIF